MNPAAAITFTPREKEILRAAAAGNGQVAIARSLGIAPRTCSAHLNHIYLKIGIHGAAGQRKGPYLSGWARENGFGDGGPRQ